LPNGLERRDNKVFETITIDEEEITVTLYDNAEIDGDIITVLFNGEVVAQQKSLTDKPITLKLKAIKGRDNTLTMYAENQGKIPPNTAIMRVQSGDNYYKVFLSADDKKNASVVFRVK
jgi:zinc protease